MTKKLAIELLHAYRALLRATTYLPDSAARTYIHSHIVHRFKSAAGKLNKQFSVSDREVVVKDPGQRHIREAWRYSRFLERAGQGDKAELKKVLLLTYGRTGKRKRKLIRDLIRPAESSLPEDEKALEELIQHPSGPQALKFKPNAKFHSFLRSQSANSPAENPNPKIKHLAPKIPDENIWGRSVPLKLQKSLRTKWWANTLGKVLPPIPLHEFNKLRDLSSGKIPIEEPPPRRSRPRPEPLPDQENDLKVWDLLKNPARLLNSSIDEAMFDPNRGLRILEEEEKWKPIFDPGRESKILLDNGKGVESAAQRARSDTNRFMRRIYASIWNLTSTMSQDEVTKLWVTTWGGGKTKAHSGEVTAPSIRDEELFEGLEDKLFDPPQKGKNLGKKHEKARYEEKGIWAELTTHPEPAIQNL
jgi:hypothetical protein